jgi:predicted O-methyltransferase YrrM
MDGVKHKRHHSRKLGKIMTIQKRGELINLLHHFSLPLRVAEIGVAQGLFAQEIYNNWKLEHLYLVDIWEMLPFIDGCASFDQAWHDKNYEEVLLYFHGKKDVTVLKGFSHKMAQEVNDESLGMVYIDGDHSYQGCKADIKFWWPKLAPGGIMAFHDYANGAYGVNRAVIEFVKGEHNVHRINEDGNTENIGAWIRK